MTNIKITVAIAATVFTLAGCAAPDGELCSGTADCEAWLAANPQFHARPDIVTPVQSEPLDEHRTAPTEERPEDHTNNQHAIFLRCDYEAHAATIAEHGILMPIADYLTLRNQCMQAQEATQ